MYEFMLLFGELGGGEIVEYQVLGEDVFGGDIDVLGE